MHIGIQHIIIINRRYYIFAPVTRRVSENGLERITETVIIRSIECIILIGRCKRIIPHIIFRLLWIFIIKARQYNRHLRLAQHLQFSHIFHIFVIGQNRIHPHRIHSFETQGTARSRHTTNSRTLVITQIIHDHRLRSAEVHRQGRTAGIRLGRNPIRAQNAACGLNELNRPLHIPAFIHELCVSDTRDVRYVRSAYDLVIQSLMVITISHDRKSEIFTP